MGEAGMVALIYYNRGVLMSREKRHAEALGMYFRALSLDRELASAVTNVLAALSNWSSDLVAAGRHEQALDVLRVGLDLAPEHGTLQHNRKVAWSQWGTALAQAGHVERALEVLHEAHAALEEALAAAADARDLLPNERSSRTIRGLIYDLWGRSYIEAHQWEEAIECSRRSDVGSGGARVITRETAAAHDRARPGCSTCERNVQRVTAGL